MKWRNKGSRKRAEKRGRRGEGGRNKNCKCAIKIYKRIKAFYYIAWRELYKLNTVGLFLILKKVILSTRFLSMCAHVRCTDSAHVISTFLIFKVVFIVI